MERTRTVKRGYVVFGESITLRWGVELSWGNRALGTGKAGCGVRLAAVAAGSAAMAQGNGQAGITEATQLVTGYFDPGTKLIYAIGAVIGLVGGIKVYQKFSSGDPDTSKTASSWFGACIFLIVAATILRSFFL